MQKLTEHEKTLMASTIQYTELKTLERVCRMLLDAGERRAEEIVRSYWRMIKPEWWKEEP